MTSQHLEINTEIKTDYDLCINHPVEYQKKVNSISDLLLLKAKDRLKNDNCAAYVIGKPKSKFVLFSLNPGYVHEWNVREDKELRQRCIRSFSSISSSITILKSLNSIVDWDSCSAV